MKEDRKLLLYIHIPFCNSKCYYCGFNSYTGKRDLWKEYLEGLISQFNWLQQIAPARFKTLFIGGGTPSTMDPEFYHLLMEVIEPYLIPGGERTIEANPDLPSGWLTSIAPYFNRISFGVQSFNREKLKFLGRSHSSKEAIEAVEEAYQVGFKNINLDLIYGVKGDSWELLSTDLQIAFSLPITHISAYSLTIEPGTLFARRPDVRLNSEELELRFIETIKERFFQYEISNFGKICRHNLGYWQLEEYRGIGAGAVGFERTNSNWKELFPEITSSHFRYYHSNQIEKYIQNPMPIRVEPIGKKELKTEKLLLGLRSIVGVNKAILSEPELKRANQLVKMGFLEEKRDRLYSRRFELADRLALEILSV